MKGQTWLVLAACLGGTQALGAAKRCAPVNLSPPVISGQAQVGAELSATTGRWRGGGQLEYRWERCDRQGDGCQPIPGAAGPRYPVGGEDPMHTLRVTVTARNRCGSASAGSRPLKDIEFAEGTICNASGKPRPAPVRLQHVIVILMENENDSDVIGNVRAPYFNSLLAQCGYAALFDDNMFVNNLNSLPHYLALTSGSNCNVGVGSRKQTPGAQGCVIDDAEPAAHRLSTRSIFNQVASYKSYAESMPAPCQMQTSGLYAARHNPAVYYEKIPSCAQNVIPIAPVKCPLGTDQTCGPPPQNALVDDLAHDTLPAYAFVVPDLMNDMHNGTVSQADNWLHTYLPRIFASRAWRSGGTALYILWDEQSSLSFGGPTPNAFLSPYIAPTADRTHVMNLFSALRAMEDQLGISEHLGCAGGIPPGGLGTCAAGSTTDLRSIFNF